MKNINIKAVIYGYVAYFIPGFILNLFSISDGHGMISYSLAFMILGGYVTAKFSQKNEIINSIALGCLAAAFSLLTIGIMYVSTDQNYEIGKLAFYGLEIIISSLAAALLGGTLRIIQNKKQTA